MWSLNYTSHLLVAAVEVGITNSRFGFSPLNQFCTDPLNVTTLSYSKRMRFSSTISTTLLLDEKKNFVAFGSDADEKYEELAFKGEEKKYYYINLGLMPSNRNKLTIKSTIADATGKDILIKDVFTHGITYMTRHFISQLNKHTELLKEHVTWVFIAPFGREDDKEFMRDAAEQAGIGPDEYAVATRQEALMFYFMYHLRRERVGRKKEKYTPENMYILVDAREYDVEITVMEIQANGKMKQITNIIDESCGRMEVFHLFEKILCRVFGDSLLEECKEKNLNAFKDMMDDFFKKLTCILNDDKNLNLNIPLEIRGNNSSTEDINVNAEGCKLIHDVFRVPFSSIKPLVIEVAQNVTELIRKFLESEQTRGAHTILMTGQMSSIRVFQEYLKHNIPDMRVIISKDFYESHIIGGVAFGHTNGILSRSHFKLDIGIETYAEIDFVPKQL